MIRKTLVAALLCACTPEVAPMAPRPEQPPVSNPPGIPGPSPSAPGPTFPTADAGIQIEPAVFKKKRAPSVDAGISLDALPADAGVQPLPPIPDAQISIDAMPSK